MSTTTRTLPPSSAGLQTVLADYELKYTTATRQETRRTTGLTTVAPQTPPGWDESHRRVPAYRPVDPGRLTPDRNTTRNMVEATFIRLLFMGVQAQADWHAIWRATGEKVFGPLNCAIGGEW
ncbi:hypothetical protein IL306_013670 [Fusarium sp. DS 682]|nr:hypothetical protein IL306_013670 [Fusarium sp. DS 682]